MHFLTTIRAATAALLCICVSNVSQAQLRPAVLMFDTSAGQVSGARLRIGFERLPATNEKAMWNDPDGQWDSTAIVLLAGGGILGAGLGDAHAQAERNASIKELRAAAAQSERLKRVFEAELRRSIERNGYEASRTVRANGLTDGHAARALVQPEDGVGITVQKIAGSPIVTLSWDDRQPLLGIDLRVYTRHETGRGIAARNKARSVVRYVGYQALEGQDPRGYWSADGANAFMAEVEAGLQRMLSLVWDDTRERPKVPRKETTTLQVAGTPQVFPGRLWKQEEGAAYLFNHDGGTTIIATAGPPIP